jgi:hypothetical protein
LSDARNEIPEPDGKIKDLCDLFNVLIRRIKEDVILFLGIEPKQKNELNDKEELENLADIIKQAMFQDYKIAYSEEGDMHKEEAQSTVTVG